MPESPPSDPPPPKKRRGKWRRRLGIFFLLFCLFLVWANGPGIRWLLRTLIDQQLENQELAGSYQLDGTALSGISLREVSLSGPALVHSAESNLIEVRWSLSSLIDLEIEALTVDRLHLTLDLAELPPPDESETAEPEKEAATPLSETLNLVRGILANAEISLTDLDVTLVDTTRVSLASLTHEATSDTYLIRDLKTKDHLDRPIHNPATTLIWTEDGFKADLITLRTDLALRNLVFHPEELASLELSISGHDLRLSSDLAASHRIELLTPGLTIAKIGEQAGIEIPVSGSINTLTADTSTGFVDLKVGDFSYEDYQYEVISLEARTEDMMSPFEQPVTLDLKVDETLSVQGTIQPDREPLDSSADLSFVLNWPGIPAIRGETVYDSREVLLLAESLKTLRVTGSFDLETKQYRAEALAAIEDASTISDPLAGALSFTARARGDLEAATHSGSLDLTELNLRQPEFPEATSQAKISWNWPEEVSVEELKMTSPAGELSARLGWQDDTLTISKFDLREDEVQLLSLNASLPAPLEFESLDKLLASERPVSLNISSEPLSFKTLSSFAPLPPDLAGVVQASLTLSGSLAEPVLDGFATLDDARLTTQPDLPPVDLNLQFKTSDNQLSLTANAKEPGGPLLDLKGEVPFLPRAWLDRKSDPAQASVSLSAKTPKISLQRIRPFVPIITMVDGTLGLDVTVSGTLSEPKLAGSGEVRIAKMRLEESPISNFRDSVIKASFAENKVTILPSTIKASGGTATLGGTIEITPEAPRFDVSLSGKYILLYRNADFTFRGNPDLKLSGTLDSATISGKLGIVESLIYKDVEILPFGVSRTSEIPSPNLPTFVPRKLARRKAPTRPTGPMTWKLDIDIETIDPVLIRGNLAKGQVTGRAKVGGTIGDPTTSGTLKTEKLVADLPFSELEVQTGIITLRPDSLTNPVINLRGRSEVGQYVIQVYLSGPVQNPKLVLTSDPPMPEGEIMLLLATGSASDQLSDQQLASQKALQYLLEGLRRRNGDKDKSVFQRLIKNSDQIELSLGDTNQFSGRRFSSATLEITDRWDFTTQIDEQGQTRALLIFSVRLK
ncbi:MAG: translocation/assembly module TamB domain-containing protein [Akkermansiaceae bacterium]